MIESQDTYSVAHEVGRGDAPHIKRHLRRYLSYFQGKKFVVDLGCGRGEFLELLTEMGIPNAGVEANRQLVLDGRKRGLTLHRSDVFAFVRKCRPQSVDGFFLSHIIEHLQPREAMAAFQAMGRALKPGGVLVIVTPNCRSLSVISHSFWRDLTHIRPYPADLLELLGRETGLDLVEKGETDLDTSANPLMRFLRSAARGAYRAFRRVLVGNFFRPFDLFVVFKKQGP